MRDDNSNMSQEKNETKMNKNIKHEKWNSWSEYSLMLFINNVG